MECNRNSDEMKNTQRKADRKVTIMEIMSGKDSAVDAPCDKRRVKGDVTAVFTYLYVCHQEIFKFMWIHLQGKTSIHCDYLEGS